MADDKPIAGQCPRPGRWRATETWPPEEALAGTQANWRRASSPRCAPAGPPCNRLDSLPGRAHRNLVDTGHRRHPSHRGVNFPLFGGRDLGGFSDRANSKRSARAMVYADHKSLYQVAIKNPPRARPPARALRAMERGMNARPLDRASAAIGQARERPASQERAAAWGFRNPYRSAGSLRCARPGSESSQLQA
jgi:hypothetical protein